MSRKRVRAFGATLPYMTMYLSNREVRPTGYEAGEFVETAPQPPTADASLATPEIDEDSEPSVR